MVALLARREREGLSLRELSTKTGIAVGTLSWWSWRLRQDSGGEAERQCGFVEVVTEPVGVRGGGPVEIELRNGIRLAIDDQVDLELLRRVVGVLQTC